ncbi:MAG TPA: energy transducer TonB [Steroidobacteraceae bacterium]|nr:energy transducer TonB [Steroidobacteraceae bacterium]
MGMVAAIHVAVLFAIMKSLGIGTPMEEPVLEGRFIDEPRPPDDPLPPPPDVPVIRYEGVVLPNELPPLDFEQPDVITAPPVPDDYVNPHPTAGSAEPQPQIVSVRQDPRNPLSRPPYSARMIREGNQGNIDLEIYVLANGRVADARVIKSTGFEELDRAALAEAKRNWRLLPATRDGVAIPQWHRLRVTFKLNQQ